MYKVHFVDKRLRGDIGEFDSIHSNGICNEALIDGLQTVDLGQIKNMKAQLKAKNDAKFSYIKTLKSLDE